VIVIEVRPTLSTWVYTPRMSPTFTGRMKLMLSRATVTTRHCAR
jgi:hypothetical protein